MKKTQAERSNSSVTNTLANYGRVAVTYVQGSPKGGGAWIYSFQVTTTRLSWESIMRLELVGSYTLDEFKKSIEVILDDLQSNKINSLQNVIMHFQTCNDGRRIVLTNDGETVEHMFFNFARHQQIEILSPHISIATFQETSTDSD